MLTNFVIFGSALVGAIIVGRVGTTIADKYIRKEHRKLVEDLENLGNE